MEITQQPSTIGEMTLEHFETYITAIIKHITDERLDHIERSLGRLERNQDLIGALVLEHDNQLRNMAVA